MTERPILFQGAMVRALLAGTKTQTRRMVKNVKHLPNWGSSSGRVGGAWLQGSPAALGLRERGDHWSCVLEGDALRQMCTQQAYGWGAGAGCPYGVPGDRLWVRESHWWFKDEHDPVTGYFPPKLTAHDVEYRADGEKPGRVWRPSIHMPRWASRITLEVTDVRVERLQSISTSDAWAEGIPSSPDVDPVHQYHDLWESINGAGSWDANPWVWAVSFKRIQ